MNSSRGGIQQKRIAKGIHAWKAIVSALVSLNMDKMPKDDKEREWYRKIGFLAPNNRTQHNSEETRGAGL